ncbi:MAG TPA: NAD(+)--dinitrogen-reductase ADP-D-ribosyltransferase [Methylophilaceae bacterium]|jgi:NAD+--dinitrogen-reductase ADP-D-ribosyltransferase
MRLPLPNMGSSNETDVLNAERWDSTNLVGIPSGLIASVAFNDQPQHLRIAGALESHRGLFHLLEESKNHADAAIKFKRYMQLVFQLKPTKYERLHAEVRRFRPSYLKLMEGWGFDSNSPQGAVLKGWVENRFGMAPTFHKAPLQQYPSPAWTSYLQEKYACRFHNNNIYQQLDLLYEFCQFVITRYGLPHANKADTHVTLWRGINLHDEPNLSIGKNIANKSSKEPLIVRLNNLVSLTTSRERADEFGDWLLELQVPKVKILFFPQLLQNQSLSGEGEVLALGGLYHAKASYV